MLKSNPSIKLLVLDLDGTALASDKSFSERNKRAVENVANSGIKVIFATGRSIIGIADEILQLSCVRYVIASNGARIFDLGLGKSLYECYLSNTALEMIMNNVRKFKDTSVSLYCNGSCFMDRVSYDKITGDKNSYPQWFREYITKVQTVYNSVEEIDMHCVEKVVCFFKSREVRKKAISTMRFVEGVQVSSGNDYSIEIADKTVSKGNSLGILAKMLGIRNEEIMSIGDNENDRSMFEVSGISVAMENAEDSIKLEADYVTKSNDNDGVAYIIEKLLL